MKLSRRAAECERRIRRMENDRPNFERRIAAYGEHERRMMVEMFEASVEKAKKELEEILRTEGLE